MTKTRRWECDWCQQYFMLPDQASEMLEEIQTCPSRECPEASRPLTWLMNLADKVSKGEIATVKGRLEPPEIPLESESDEEVFPPLYKKRGKFKHV